MAIMFEDTFDRADSDTVGEGWTEDDPANSIRIRLNTLEFHFDGATGEIRKCVQDTTLINTFIKEIVFRLSHSGFTNLDFLVRLCASWTDGIEYCGVRAEMESNYNLYLVEGHNGGSPGETDLSGPHSLNTSHWAKIIQIRDKLKLFTSSDSGAIWNYIATARLVTNSPTQKTGKVSITSVNNGNGVNESRVNFFNVRQHSPRLMRVNK